MTVCRKVNITFLHYYLYKRNNFSFQVALILDRYDSTAFGVIDKENQDPTRLTLHYKFNR